MNAPNDKSSEHKWSRPRIDRDRPNRKAGGFYRSAQDGGRSIGGVPMTTAEDAVVAGVRLAYSVAEQQIKRSNDLGRRLREAGDRAVGPGSDRKALDATEKIVFDAGMSVLAWLEALAAEDGSPMKRLLVAQYKIVGSLLGIVVPDPPAKENEQKPAAQPAQPKPQYSQASERAAPAAKLVLRGDCKRPVLLHRLDRIAQAPCDYPIQFYSAEQIESEAMDAHLSTDEKGRATLQIEVGRHAVSGRWKAAICDAEGTQLGMIEIEL